MYALFLESKAAAQVRAFAAARAIGEVETEVLLLTCYKHGKDHANHFQFVHGDDSYDDWWVNMCLDGDSHKYMCINQLITWAETPEGKPFWREVNQYGGNEE